MHISHSEFSNEWLLEVLQTSKDAMAIYVSEDLHIRFANDAMLKIWGKNRSVIGKTFEEAIPEIIGQPFTALLQLVWRTGVAYSARETPAQLMVDGELQTFYFDFEYSALKDDVGKTFCIVHRATDVTQRRQSILLLAEKEEEEQSLNEELASTVEELLSTNEELNQSLVLLAESREHLKSLMDQAPIGLCFLQGEQMVIEMANHVILDIWGRTEAEVVGKPHAEARPELADQPMNSWLAEVYATGIPRKNDALRVMLYQNGARREAFVNSVYQPVKSSNGAVTGIIIILEEITDQILARQAHDKDQQMLELAINAGELGTFFYEPATNLFSGNNLLKKWFGLQPEEMLDLGNATAAIVETDRDRVINAIAAAVSVGSEGRYDIDYQIQNLHTGEKKMIRALGRTTFNAQGLPLSLNGTVQDITEQKKDEQRKDDFISMVSHELKTPLTSLNAYVQLLQRISVKKEDRVLADTLEKALKQIRNMTSMINGFLNVSRLESGKLLIDKSQFDLAALFAEMQEDIALTTHSHNLNFHLHGPAVVDADREKISQVIQNLVSNAIKYAPMGSNISIDYKKNGDKFIVVVEDKGMGIADADQKFIFERYYRVKHPKMGSIAGFGIGLYLCKEIIERHGGEIWLESSIDEGTTFYFSLPANAVQF